MILYNQRIAYSGRPNSNRMIYTRECLERIAKDINIQAKRGVGCVTNAPPKFDKMITPDMVIGKTLSANVTEDGQLFCDIDLIEDMYATARFTIAGLGKAWQAESYYTIMPEDYEFVCLVAVANSAFDEKGANQNGDDTISV